MNPTVKLLTQQLHEAETAHAQALVAQRSAMDSLAEAGRRAEQLMLYRQEYENGWGSAARSSGDSRLLAHHHEVIDRLCREIDAQQVLQRTAATKLATLRATLRNRESHILSVKAALARQHKLRLQAPKTQPAAAAEAALARFRKTLFALTTSDNPFGAVAA